MSVTLWAGLAAAVVVVTLLELLAPPRRRLSGRIAPYVALARPRLGAGPMDLSVLSATSVDDRSSIARVFQPVADRWFDLAGRVVDVADDETIRRRLQHAGVLDLDPDQYRLRQVLQAVAGVATGCAVGLLVIRSAVGTLLFALLLGFPAATMQRNRLERATRERTATMRAEIATVAQLLAVHTRTGAGSVEAVRSVAVMGSGPVSGELRQALGWISGGTSPARAYDKLAEATAEPVAARLYRVLAGSARSGADVSGGLLAVANDVRDERRDEVARLAVRRRTAMLLPLLLFIAPVMVLFVAAALPSLVFG